MWCQSNNLHMHTSQTKLLVSSLMYYSPQVRIYICLIVPGKTIINAHEAENDSPFSQWLHKIRPEPQLPDKSAELPGTSQLFSCPDPCLYSLSIPNNVMPDAFGFFNTNTWSNIAFTQVSFTDQIIHHPLTAATLMWDMAFLTWLLMQHLFNCTGASDLCHVWIKVLITLDAKDIFARKMLCSV